MTVHELINSYSPFFTDAQRNALIAELTSPLAPSEALSFLQQLALCEHAIECTIGEYTRHGRDARALFLDDVKTLQDIRRWRALKDVITSAMPPADSAPLNEYRFTTDCFITVSIEAPNEEAAWERVQAALSDRNWDDLRMFGADECEAHGVSECAQINIGHNPIFQLVSTDDPEARDV